MPIEMNSQVNISIYDNSSRNIPNTSFSNFSSNGLLDDGVNDENISKYSEKILNNDSPIKKMILKQKVKTFNILMIF